MAGPTVCLDCSGLLDADLALADALAHLHLELRRARLALLLDDPTLELRELLALAGLAGVLGVEAGGQAEEREEPRGVEEEGQLADPPA